MYLLIPAVRTARSGPWPPLTAVASLFQEGEQSLSQRIVAQVTEPPAGPKDGDHLSIAACSASDKYDWPDLALCIAEITIHAVF